MSPDTAALADLARFARIEVDSHDLEPWAEVLRALRDDGAVTLAEAGWLVKLYNAYDAFDSAWKVYRRWPSLAAWFSAPDAADAGSRDYPCTQERRNLRAGKVVKHLGSYALHALPDPDAWLRSALTGDSPTADWTQLTHHVRIVWGVGRQTAFEWAEFAAKVCDVPVEAPDADLWESEGPRRSLQRIYGGNARSTLTWLNRAATHCRDYLADAGVPLAWVDFETVICDFNVMRDGRYYPGRHLAALAEEIALAASPELRAAWDRVIPPPWRDIAPGIDKAQLPVYRDSGRIVDEPAVA